MNDTSPTSNPKSLRDLLRTIELVHTACDGDYQFASKRTLELLEPFSALIHDLPVETTEEQTGPCSSCIEAHTAIDELGLGIASGDVADRVGDLIEMLTPSEMEPAPERVALLRLQKLLPKIYDEAAPETCEALGIVEYALKGDEWPTVEPTAELSDGDHELYVVSPEDRLREIVRSIDPPPPLPTLDELRNDTEFEPLSPDKTTQDSGA